MENNKQFISAPSHFSLFISSSLKGISQVILIENRVTGFIIFLALSIFSLEIGITALISAMIGTLIGSTLGRDTTSVHSGLFGFNSVLAGEAMIIFIDGSNRWVFALVGAAVAAIFYAAMVHLTKNLDLVVLSFPYIIVTWFLLLASYKFETVQISPDLIPQSLSHGKLVIEEHPHWIKGLINGIGEIFFVNSFWASMLILLGAFWAGWRYGIYALVGTIVAWLTAYFLGAETKLLNLGLYGYNAVLTIIAISLVFNAKRRIFPITGIVAAILSVLVTASVDTVLKPYGLPALTMPFVLCAWLFLSAKKILPNL